MLCTPTVIDRCDRPSSARAHEVAELRTTVGQMLAGVGRAQRLREKRRENRLPYPYLIQLLPVAEDGTVDAEQAIVVVGKHISVGGVDFYHRDPLPHRRMIAWLDAGGGQHRAVLLELLWCRFNKQGWYENGGRFLRLAENALAAS